jgi:two-component system cell cycle sensor histidine kinase/response regulator CckA
MATVLVVDDRAANREVARAALDFGGHQVIEAAEGAEALRVARLRHPDVVVADVLMPGMDGYEFVHQLRADPDTADIPVLLYTANYRPEEANPLARAYGATKVVAKTAGPAELLAAVDEALHERPAAAPAPDREVAAQHLHAVNAKLLEKVQALDESQARLVTIGELSPVGLVVGDPAGMATYVNPRLSALTGLPAEALLGTGWLRLVDPAQRTAMLTADAGEEIRHDYAALVDGLPRRFSVTMRFQPADEGPGRAGFIATVDDVTALIETEQRRHAEQHEQDMAERRRIAERFDALARLSGGIAHDFNNLLNVILSFVDFIGDTVTGAVGTELSRERAGAMLGDLDQINRAGKRASHLTHQLLTFGGREVVQPTVIDVNDAVREVRGLLAPTVGQHVTIRPDLDPGVAHVRADGSQLCQVLINLAINARDAMPHGGLLVLRTTNMRNDAPDPVLASLPAGDYVDIAVIDEGEGMSEEVIHKAIEPFFTTKARGKGSGLGLATAYGIVKQAGGELVIDSTVGTGTTIHLYLPATAEPLKVVHAPAGDHAAAGETILIAEDEDGLREVAARMLSSAGYRVLTAINGEDALETASRHDGPVHAVLTDVVMPRLNGPQWVAVYHAEHPDTPVLYMSGYAGPLMSEQGLLDEGVTVLSKPFTRTGLLDAIRALLGTAAARSHRTG